LTAQNIFTNIKIFVVFTEKWTKSEGFREKSLKADNNKTFEEIKENFLKKDDKPLNIAQEEQNRIDGELVSLRNKVCVIFIMLNIVFVSIIYILTHISAYQGTLSVSLWCQSQDVAAQTKLEPISITFILMFGLLLLVQFISMLGHRISTMIHVLASNKNKRNLDEQRHIDETKMQKESKDPSNGQTKGPKKIKETA